MNTVIVLIGPINAGKSTIAALLSDKLNFPRYRMDRLRFDYYQEIGYDEKKASNLLEKEGFIALCDYWKPFDGHAVKRVVEDCDYGIIDFGGGLSVYRDNELLRKVDDILKPIENVVLLTPSENFAESFEILNNRERVLDEDRKKLNKHFIEHPSNRLLAKHTFFTKGKPPEQTCNEIIERLKLKVI